MLESIMIKSFVNKTRAFGLLIATALLTAGTVSGEEGAGLQSAQTKVGSIATLQRGARLYFNYCSGCHSIKYMSYSRLSEDLQLSKDEVLNNFGFTGAKIGDQIVSHMPADNS